MIEAQIRIHQLTRAYIHTENARAHIQLGEGCLRGGGAEREREREREGGREGGRERERERGK